MEIKATLNKPYTDKQRMDFIVTNNHQQGYQIKEADSALEAWGYTSEEIASQDIQNQINILKEELDKIDVKSIRPSRAIQSGNGTQDDIDRLTNLEAQAVSIRQQIKELQGE